MDPELKPENSEESLKPYILHPEILNILINPKLKPEHTSRRILKTSYSIIPLEKTKICNINESRIKT